MLKKVIAKCLVISLLITSALAFTGTVSAVSSMTPYTSWVTPSTWFQGAEYELNPGMDTAARILRDLPDMKNNYNINSLNLYGLENISQSDRDLLFSTMSSLGMQAVVRIEWYDGSWMNFENADADTMINHYTSLIADVCSSAKRNQVAYFALNVPVDDPAVVAHFVTGQYTDGRQNPLWASSQVSFVNYFVSRMRTVCSSYGFTTAKQYVSVFYGWDYSYPVPSYSASNADGYFFNNYTYPVNGSSPPDETATDAVIINQTRLQQGMTKFMSQYPTQNKTIEYGFHTSEFNNGVNPNQTAGLVKTKAAKQKALKATTTYYKNNFSTVKGSFYFGHNLLKEEGNPLALMDWCMEYPYSGKSEAENIINAKKYGHAVDYTDAAASGGKGVSGLDATGDALAFYNSKKGTSLQIRYACAANAQLSLYINGAHNQDVAFTSTGAWTGTYATKTVTVTIPWGATIRLQRDSGDSAINVDYVMLP